MKRIAARGAVYLAALSLAVACTSALKEPPPVAELGAAQPPTGIERRDDRAALAEAEIEFGKVPDMEAVRRAQGLFLAAAQVDGAPVGAFIGAGKATAWLVEHEEDGRRREELATEGVQIGQWCRRLFPPTPSAPIAWPWPSGNRPESVHPPPPTGSM